MRKILFYTAISLLIFSSSALAEDDWRKTGIAQTYLQNYSGTTNRQLSFNAGAYLKLDYLDSGGFGLGYNYTFTDFDYNAELTEHIFYVTGFHDIYMDTISGKITLRLDAYLGEDTLSYNINNPPGHTGGGGMGRRTSGNSSTVSESTDISALQPQISYINFAKTFYLDLGYAYSEYSGEVTTKVDQVTPTAGFGWNQSYDWLQLRGYFIWLNEPLVTQGKDQYESFEIKYTHWYEDSTSIIDFWRLSALTGERILAIDSDAGVIYSTADMQKYSLSASIQWKLRETSRIMTLVDLTQFENESTGDKYDGILLYLNLQKKW